MGVVTSYVRRLWRTTLVTSTRKDDRGVVVTELKPRGTVLRPVSNTTFIRTTRSRI